MKSFKQSYTTLLERLRVRTPVGGLEISDSALRFIVHDHTGWETYNQRLSAGTIEDGVIKDEKQFEESIKALRSTLEKRYGQKKIPVVLSLSSSQIYTQTFSLPAVKKEEKEKAIDLNLKMISPLEYQEVYGGWQELSQNTAGHTEILGGFLKRSIADTLDSALEAAGFRPLALESRAMSLTRLARETQPLEDRSAVIVLVDDEGIHLLVVKKGFLYFEYTELWKNMYQTGQSITMDEFRSAIKHSIQQLVNFHGQRWSEPLGEFLVIAASLAPEVMKILKEDFAFEAKEMSIPSVSLNGEWFAALGAAQRGQKIGSSDEELSLLGHTAREEFGKEQITDFLSLWSVLVPVSLGIIMLAMISADFFIIEETRRLSEVVPRQLSPEDQLRITELKNRANQFNADVAAIQEIRAQEEFKLVLIDDIFTRASSTQIKITQFNLLGNGMVNLSGRAKDQERVIAFKNNIREAGYPNVDLPLSSIREEAEDYAFSMSFSWMPAKTP